MSKESGAVSLKVNLDTSEADELAKKLEALNGLLEKANSLLSELASKKDIDISVSVNGADVE